MSIERVGRHSFHRGQALGSILSFLPIVILPSFLSVSFPYAEPKSKRIHFRCQLTSNIAQW